MGVIYEENGKMKKIIVMGLLGCFCSVQADTFSFKEQVQLTDNQKNEIFTKNGLPHPGEPPKVIPLKQLMADMPKEIRESQQKTTRSIARKGYVEEININALKMLSERDKMKADIQNNLNNPNPMYTHLRATPKALKTGFEYKTFSNDIASEVIGFSPQGTYMKDFGWSGASEFFVPKEMEEDTLCVYNQTSIKMNGATASYAKENVTYTVNKKLSSSVVIGNEDSAFSYNIEWWDSEIFHELECFQKNYSKKTMNKVIGIAQAIDKSISG